MSGAASEPGLTLPVQKKKMPAAVLKNKGKKWSTKEKWIGILWKTTYYDLKNNNKYIFVDQGLANEIRVQFPGELAFFILLIHKIRNLCCNSNRVNIRLL